MANYKESQIQTKSNHFLLMCPSCRELKAYWLWWRSVKGPVSYTHLDVYKRQYLFHLGCFPQNNTHGIQNKAFLLRNHAPCQFCHNNLSVKLLTAWFYNLIHCIVILVFLFRFSLHFSLQKGTSKRHFITQ